MTQNTGPTPPIEHATTIASMYSDLLTGGQLIDLENAIIAAMDSVLAEQAARLAHALAYCADADNESMEQARTIRAQAIEIERLKAVLAEQKTITANWRGSCHQAWRDLSAARAELDQWHIAGRAAAEAVIETLTDTRRDAEAEHDPSI